MKKILFTALVFILLGNIYQVHATAFESNTAAEGDQETMSGTNNGGQTFTASSDHTITSMDIYLTTPGTTETGTVKLHVTTASGDTSLGSDLYLSPTFTVTSPGANTVIIPCIALTNGTQYGFWLDWQSGSFHLSNTLSNAHPFAGGVALKSSPDGLVKPSHPFLNDGGEDQRFTVFGDSGSCASATPAPIYPPVLFFE